MNEAKEYDTIDDYHQREDPKYKQRLEERLREINVPINNILGIGEEGGDGEDEGGGEEGAPAREGAREEEEAAGGGPGPQLLPARGVSAEEIA